MSKNENDKHTKFDVRELLSRHVNAANGLEKAFDSEPDYDFWIGQDIWTVECANALLAELDPLRVSWASPARTPSEIFMHKAKRPIYEGLKELFIDHFRNPTAYRPEEIAKLPFQPSEFLKLTSSNGYAVPEKLQRSESSSCHDDPAIRIDKRGREYFQFGRENIYCPTKSGSIKKPATLQKAIRALLPWNVARQELDDEGRDTTNTAIANRLARLATADRIDSRRDTNLGSRLLRHYQQFKTPNPDLDTILAKLYESNCDS